MTSTPALNGSLADRVAGNPLWYHTLELAPGVVTPGWFDYRSVVDRLPWPDVRGKRCLDIGTYDGFIAFELERRGAREVVATDIADHAGWDWSFATRSRGPAYLASIAGTKGMGFEIARDALGSKAERIELSIYDLTPERVGTFDVAVCGSLLLHLRDPIRALEAVRGVCAGVFLSAEQIDLRLTLLHPRRALAKVMGGNQGQWWIPNSRGHANLLTAAGFELRRAGAPYCVAFGAGHAHRPDGGWRDAPRMLLERAVARGEGVPHIARLVTPLRT